MSGGKELQRQLKGPDAFQAKMLSILNSLMKRKSLVVAILAGVIVVAAAIGGVSYFSRAKNLDRKEELAKIDAVYNSELQGVDKEREQIQKQIAALRAQIPTDAKEKKPEHAKMESEIKALEDKMGDLKANHDASLAQYKAFYEKYPEAPEGWAAGMRYAAALLDQDKNSEARPILENIFAKSRDSLVYQVQSGMTLIGVLEDAGDFDAAIEKADALLKVAPDAIKPKILLAKGRLQLEKNAKDAAAATLDGLIQDHGATPEADQARGMKALLN